MAKKNNNKSMEETLWDSANKLRGTGQEVLYKIANILDIDVKELLVSNK